MFFLLRWDFCFFFRLDFNRYACDLVFRFAILSGGGDEGIACAGFANRFIIVVRITLSGCCLVLVFFYRDFGVQDCFFAEAAPYYPGIRCCELTQYRRFFGVTVFGF